MFRPSLRALLPGILLVQAVAGQPVLRLKTRTAAPEPQSDAALVVAPAALGPGHMILQFNDLPGAEAIAALTARGVNVLADVPDNALLISSAGDVAVDDLDVRLAISLNAGDKTSPLFSDTSLWARGYFLVEFHPDVDVGLARGLVLNAGIELRDNPDLSGHHLLVYIGGPDRARTLLPALAAADEVAYIFPASDELIAGTPAP